MGLPSGTRLGPYEIVEPLGAGGMGEVYRGRDTRLDRTVAIKVLNSQLVAGPEVRARFEREAKVVSQLQHPNICVLHDIGADNGTDFLVMEFLEGETLAERLRKGPVAPAQLTKIGSEIAEALDKAHRAGIVHRDLKPGNVMLTKSGAKLLDFGLAKPVATGAAAGASAPLLSAAMTMTAASPQASPLTTQGSVVGTIQYMSPEQLQGLEADARSDIFAFGAMLYEMATGKCAFDGKSQISVASAILDKDPEPISALQPATPAALDYCVRTCLNKNPDERYQTAHDVKLQLKWAAEAGSHADVPAASSQSSQSKWMLAAAVSALLAAALGAAFLFSRPTAEVHPMQLSFTVPAGLAFNSAQADAAVISPDGQKVVFTATSPDGKWQLWVRRLDSPDAQLLPGTEDPLEPFWSPDSRSIAFGSKGKLKRVDLAGGSAQVLCDAARMTGGAWNTKGVIVFGSDYGSALYQVPATGGEPKPVTAKQESEADYGHTGPAFLPDQRHFLYRININASPRGVWVGSLDSLERKQVLTENTGALYVPPGYLIFVRNQALMAQPFDAEALQLKGDAVPLVAQGAVTNVEGGGIGRFSASQNGILLWQGRWQREYQLRWFDREGKQIGALGDPIETSTGVEPHLSPDGKRLVVKHFSPEANIWVMDLARGTDIRLSSTFSQLPLWTPDGKHVIYQSALDSNVLKRGIVLKPASGVGDAELLAEGVKFPQESSPDGRFLLYVMRGEKTRLDVWALRLVGDRKEHPLLNSAADERDPQISPDGKWLAYSSDETGNYEIYVRPFTSDGKVGDSKQRISTNGGRGPEWRKNGQEMFYIADDSQLMSVAVKNNPTTAEFGVPKPLFKMRTFSLYGISHEYDVSPDGQRFLVGTLVGEPKAPPPTVILNWTAGLKK